MTTSWYVHSLRIIHTEIAKHGDTFTNLDELLDHIRREHYPFGERAMWPYKMWLKAIRASRNKHRAASHARMVERCRETLEMFTL